jgi:hydroxypyruvate isomerase
MKRRTFVETSLMAGAAAALGARTAEGAGIPQIPTPFRLDYAPHFGMFREHAGGDPVDQLRFMAEQGFRSLEDNGMRGRSRREQERIAAEMGRLGMRMGVFVAHTIYWREPNLAGGEEDRREEFLDEIRSAVEVAKRVNATWMTVVPGHVDLGLHNDY